MFSRLGYLLYFCGILGGLLFLLLLLDSGINGDRLSVFVVVACAIVSYICGRAARYLFSGD